MNERMENVRLSQHAVEQIKHWIKAQKLKPGDKLPGERQLVTQLGVSRTVAREALRVLEAAGLLKVYPGRGAFVSSMNEEVLARPFVTWVQYQPDILVDLMEARRLVESQIAGLAAQRATEADIRELQAVHEQLAEAMQTGDVFKIASLDVAFHQRMADAAGNRVLLQILVSFAEPMFNSRLISLSLPDRWPVVLQRHKAILEAVAARNPEAARATMAYHLETAGDEVARRFPQLMKTEPSEQ